MMSKGIKMFTMATVLAMVIVSLSPMVSAQSNDVQITLLRADVDIMNSYAITEVSVTYLNPTNGPAEETFMFDIPEDAFISNFSLTIKGVTYYADIMKKDDAQDKYDDAKHRGDNAGLLASSGKNRFSYSVNIAAKDSVTVTLRYEDFIERTVDGFKYDLGLSSFGGRMVKVVEIDMDLGYDREIIDVNSMGYGTVTTISMSNADHSAEVDTYKTDIKVHEDLTVTWDLADLPLNGRMLFHEDAMADGEGYFLHVFNPGVSELGGYLPKDIVFVLDRSGSMGGDKMTQLKSAFTEIIGDLRAGDRFEIVVFSSSSSYVYGKMLKATQSNKDKAIRDINSISASGSTNINDGLLDGLDILNTPRERVPIMVFLTDGRANRGESNTDNIRNNVLAHNKVGVSIYCLGFGASVNWQFLEALCLENNGFAVKIETGKDAASQITDFYDTISLPLLRNVDFTYDDGTYDVYPTHVDNLYEGNDIVIVGKFDRAMDHISYSATAMTANGQREFKGAFTVDTSGEASFIKRYWAYAMIRGLMDRTMVEGETDELVGQVTNMSLEHGFVTEYTSLFVEVPSLDDPIDMPVRRDLPEYDMATGRSRIAKKDYNSAPGFDFLLVLPAVAIVAGLMTWFRRRKA